MFDALKFYGILKFYGMEDRNANAITLAMRDVFSKQNELKSTSFNICSKCNKEFVQELADTGICNQCIISIWGND